MKNRDKEKSSPIEKMLASVVNVAIVLLVSLPLGFLWGPTIKWKLSVVTLFFLYNILFIFINNNRCLGMTFVGTAWEEEYPVIHQFLYSFFYSLSFATIFIFIWFPFDLLVINLLAVQLPFVLTTGTTLHGFLSGNMATVRVPLEDGKGT